MKEPGLELVCSVVQLDFQVPEHFLRFPQLWPAGTGKANSSLKVAHFSRPSSLVKRSAQIKQIWTGCLRGDCSYPDVPL